EKEEKEEVERRLRGELEQEGRRPFDLRRGELLRGVLYRVKEQEHVLLLVLHHIAGDEWSLQVLLRELRELYDARVEGREAEVERERRWARARGTYPGRTSRRGKGQEEAS